MCSVSKPSSERSAKSVVPVASRWLKKSERAGCALEPTVSQRSSPEWQVYFEANKAIIAVGAEGKFPAVERSLKVKNAA